MTLLNIIAAGFGFDAKDKAPPQAVLGAALHFAMFVGLVVLAHFLYNSMESLTPTPLSVSLVLGICALTLFLVLDFTMKVVRYIRQNTP